MFASLHTASFATRQVQTAGGLTRLLNTLSAAFDRQRQISALARLDDRLLRDIGLSEGHVAAQTDRAAPSFPATSPARWDF